MGAPLACNEGSPTELWFGPNRLAEDQATSSSTAVLPGTSAPVLLTHPDSSFQPTEQRVELVAASPFAPGTAAATVSAGASAGRWHRSPQQRPGVCIRGATRWECVPELTEQTIQFLREHNPLAAIKEVKEVTPTP